MQFKGFTLDRFQIESINSIDKGHSVVVSAATGTGKTLIADYVIDKYLPAGKKIMYTSPIKALSNQKYADFKRAYGADKVGILTGDVSINPHAQVIILTTEIYRNMLLAKDKAVSDVSYVIFDEIHYLADIERGAVWEESIIFSPKHVRFLCLSATIPNARQFANWIQHIQKHQVDIVVEKKRPIPLQHQFFDLEKGLCDFRQLHEQAQLDKYPRYDRKKRCKVERKLQSHLDLIKQLKTLNRIPCIFFCFSRSLTEKKATSLKDMHFLKPQETATVQQYIREKLQKTDPAIAELATTHHLRTSLAKGVGFHHAGLLPILKELVEELFGMGLIRVLFATETFAVGINMPAKTVCFDSLEKYDGINFRYLNPKEYFQLAGRAGRRGLDNVGFVVSLVDREFCDVKRIQALITEDKEPIKSQFRLSYNTVLNLLHNHTPDERQVILKSSFYSYQRQGTQSSQAIISSFEHKRRKLEGLGYVRGEVLTEKGEFARQIYTQELLVGELFATEFADLFTVQELLLLCAALVHEEKRGVEFKELPVKHTSLLLQKLRQNKTLVKFFEHAKCRRLEPMLLHWFEQHDFCGLLDVTSMPEGDIVRFFRQIIDLLQQIHRATSNAELREKIEHVLGRIDRDVVRPLL
ncbi:DEAD/DEAH box helicase [Candidatus Woesearchaeota archaeon]|nr:DEAD/DEAH box helicase [Candidatus Woesearchaeota archaeon]